MRITCARHDILDCPSCYPVHASPVLSINVCAWITDRKVVLDCLALELDRAIGNVSTGCIQLEVHGPMPGSHARIA